MNSTPTVSIIIPVYNVEPYLRQCLDSVISQTFTDWECILVNDGSTDKSGSICDEYASKDSRLKVIHKVNGGSSAARNTGLEYIVGEYVFFMDSDDWVDVDYLSLVVGKAVLSDADVVISAYNEEENNTRLLPNKPTLLDSHTVIVDMFASLLHAGLWNKLVKRNIIDQYHIRFPKYNYYEDMCFSTEFMMHARKIEYCETPSYHYRVNPSSLTNSSDYSKRIKMFMEFVNNMNDLFDRLQLWDDPEIVEGLYKHVNGQKLRLLNMPVTDEIKTLLKESFPDSISQVKIDGCRSILNYISLRYAVSFPIKLVNALRKTKHALKGMKNTPPSPVISIVIPIYNVETYLPRCLDSISAQSYEDWECILVDDGSKDDSGRICDEYQEKDNRFKVIHKQNGGVSSARNVGIEVATGNWLFFSDADDTLDSKCLDLFASSIDESTAFVMAGYNKCREDGEIKETYPLSGFNTITVEDAIKELYHPTLLGYQGYLWCKLFKADIIKKNNIIFNEKIYFNEDRLFILQYLCKLTGKIQVTTTPVYNYVDRVTGAVNSVNIYYNPKFVTDFDAFLLMKEAIYAYTKDKRIRRISQTGIASSYMDVHSLMYKHRHYDPKAHWHLLKHLLHTGSIKYLPKDSLKGIMASTFFVLFPQLICYRKR